MVWERRNRSKDARRGRKRGGRILHQIYPIIAHFLNHFGGCNAFGISGSWQLKIRFKYYTVRRMGQKWTVLGNPNYARLTISNQPYM